jgi:hypothetical protein
MPEAASATSLDPVVLASSVFWRLNLWTLDEYGIHAAARPRTGFSRIPFRLVIPADRRLCRCLFVIAILIAIAIVHGRHHYLADAIWVGVVDCIVPVLVPAETTSASLSTETTLSMSCRQSNLLCFQYIHSRSQPKEIGTSGAFLGNNGC